MLIFQINILFSQTFHLLGTTDLILDGTAILDFNAPPEFYSLKIKSDTTQIHNHRFVFIGTLKKPEQFRLRIINNDKFYN